MKKLLAIVVLSLLWCNVGFAGETFQGKNGPVYEGMSKYNFCSQEYAAGWGNAFCRKKSIYFQNGIEVNDSWKVAGQRRYAIFKNVTQPIRTGTFGKKFGDGTFHALAYSWAEAQKIIAELEGTQNKSSTEKTGHNISGAKAICKDLGFKPKTEKFGDCVLKILEGN